MGKALVIDATDIVVSPRGRKADLDSDMLDDLTLLADGEVAALDLSPYFGDDLRTKEQRQGAGQVIRKHWKAVGSDAKIRIDFGANRPQVRVK